MALTYFITKFYSFPAISKDTLKKFILSDEVDKWIISYILIPIDRQKDFLITISTNNLSIFDKIEQDLLGVEIDISEYAMAYKLLGTQYESFYPSINLSRFFE